MRLRPVTITTFILLGAFVLIGPALVAWTAGYRYNSRTGKIEATGILVLESLPAGAKISIGDEDTGKTTPARLTGFLPREYAVTVSLPGYHLWRQTMTVEKNKTSFADRIRLFPASLPELVFDKPVQKIAAASDGSMLAAAVQNNGFTEVWTIDPQNGQSTLLERLASSTVRSLEWSPTGAYLLVTEDADKSGAKASVFSQGLKAKIAAPAGGLSAVAWSADDPSRLTGVSRQGKTANVWLLPSNGAAGSLLWSTTTTVPVDRDLLPLLKNNVFTIAEPRATTTLIEVAAPGSPRTPLFEVAGGPYELLPSPGSYLTLANAGRGRIAVVDQNSRRLLADLSGKNAAWSASGAPALLVWDELELHLLAPGEEPVTLMRSSEGLRAAAWLADSSYALALTSTGLYAIERDVQDGSRTITEIDTFAKTEGLALAGDSAYVAATVGQRPGIYRIKLQ